MNIFLTIALEFWACVSTQLSSCSI